MGKNGCKHVSAEHRRAIEAGLDNRDTLSGIARTIGFDVSTVRREILRNRRHSGILKVESSSVSLHFGWQSCTCPGNQPINLAYLTYAFPKRMNS